MTNGTHQLWSRQINMHLNLKFQKILENICIQTSHFQICMLRLYILICILICHDIYIYIYIYIYIHTHTHTHIIYIYIYIRTHTQSSCLIVMAKYLLQVHFLKAKAIFLLHYTYIVLHSWQV